MKQGKTMKDMKSRGSEPDSRGFIYLLISYLDPERIRKWRSFLRSRWDGNSSRVVKTQNCRSKWTWVSDFLEPETEIHSQSDKTTLSQMTQMEAMTRKTCHASKISSAQLEWTTKLPPNFLGSLNQGCQHAATYEKNTTRIWAWNTCSVCWIPFTNPRKWLSPEVISLVSKEDVILVYLKYLNQ